MLPTLLFIGFVTVACVLTNRLASKLPVPSLLIFIGIGMLLGENGPAGIAFSDFRLTESICNVALLFIMFYGGFNTNLDRARPVAVQAVLLSTVGVAATMGAVGAFAHLALGMDWLHAMLVGAVISSTDAASVFNVLREHKLALKGGADSLLEIESGSNDPLSYLLTVVFCTLLTAGQISVPAMLASQIAIGAGCGLALGWLAALVLDRVRIDMAQGETILLFATAIIAYAAPGLLGGNGFLSVYLAGIVLGASDIPAKQSMAHFFDILTEIAQMTVFFILGMLVTPARLPEVMGPAFAIVAFLTFVGRPVVVGLLLAPFRSSLARTALISWAGLRGAASTVFALVAITMGVSGARDIFDLVFVIVIVSLMVQGSLMPAVARRLDMVDGSGNVMTTFNDFQNNSALSFIKLKIGAEHPFVGKTLAQIRTMESLLVVLILHDEAHAVLPDGQTRIQAGDLLVLAAPTFEERADVSIREIPIGEHHRWANRRLRDLSEDKRFLVAMIERDGASIIPNGDTQILPGDTAIVATL